VIRARFDDLVPGSTRSFRFVRPVAEHVATSPADVAAIIATAGAEAAAGRWVAGVVAYEAAPGLDPALEVRPRDPPSSLLEPPLAWFGVFEDRETVDEPAAPVPGGEPTWRSSVPRARYVAAVERIRELIASGQTYQVNHTIRMRSTIAATDVDGVYASLVLAQRGAFGAAIDTGSYKILSASPELFFAWDGTRVTTRPMKGTAPRGRWPEEDTAVAERLRASPKDRAENAMIVDLLRNDLGRVATPGTVVAGPLFDVERYETVWQMTSTVSAEVPERTALIDLFRALFPSGSVTGAPKVASMRAIRELEESPRGVYTGAVGFLSPPGSGEPRAVFSVAIRTIVVDAETGAAEYGVGAGITFGSSGEAEFDEVEAKSRVLSERRPAFALFETLAWLPGEGYRHVEEHVDRLRRSAAYFGFAFEPGRALADLRELADEATGPTQVRVTLERSGSSSLQTTPLPQATAEPVRLAVVADPPVDPRDVWLFHKTTLRGPYERRRELRRDADDVLLVNALGRVTESTIANVAVRLDGAWCTPPLEDGLLAGTYRAVLLRDGSLNERSMTIADVRGATEVALLSSVRGWRRAVLID
jgi:para-aminobenzoate synthetase/4-amino-4-deoxychorismate lyase